MEDLTTNLLTLRPATVKDRRNVYNWLAHSNLTSEMLGPPHFPDIPIPTWETFCEDYTDHYFNGTKPHSGRCFILIHQGEEIGQINYNEINLDLKSVEIDIWLADSAFTGKGFGVEAIHILCRYLKKYFGCKTFYIGPSRRNINAIKAYKKAGFAETKHIPDAFIPDYSDTVLLVKEVP